MAVFVLVAVLVFAFAAVGEASVGSKQVKVDYNNYKIMVDGKLVSLPAGVEPFSLNGTIYLPLRVVGEALKCNVNWQGETKTAVISSGANAEINSLKLQVQSKDKEIEELKKQVAALKQQLADASRNRSLSDLERDLLEDYDEIDEVPVDDIQLKGDEDEVDVVVEVDLRYYDDEWKDLSDSDIKRYIENLVKGIQKELSKNTEVNGEIVNNDKNDVLVKFSKDGTRSLSVQYKDRKYRSGSSVSDVEDELAGDIYEVGNLEFSVYSVYYYKNRDEITVRMHARDYDASQRWDKLSTSVIEDDVESICEDIAETFEDDAGVDPEWVYISFYDEDLRLLGSYEYNVDDGSLY